MGKRVYQIDLFRFIAAIVVVLHHYLFRGHAADGKSPIAFDGLADIFKYGYLGVDFFFIISGFVIVLSIRDLSIKKFIVSRITRLYPAYWFCVILTFLVITYFGSPIFYANFPQLIANLTMLHSFIGYDNIDGVYWSLIVELQFYFLIGAFLIFNQFVKIKFDHLVLFWLGITVLHLFFKDFIIFKAAYYLLILEWSSYFIAGIIFYQIFKEGIKTKHIVLLLICLAISLKGAIIQIDKVQQHYNTSFSPYIICAAITAFYLLMFLVTTGRLQAINSPKMLQLGLLTYPLYLVHQNIGYIIFNNFGMYINKYFLLLFTVTLMLMLSYFISKYIEPPIAAFLKNVLEKRFYLKSRKLSSQT
ncbi:acyltransferase family protein [Pseudopedobacter saltans]|nr:acyltransferase [Pseudopedobacter saltans]